MNVTKIFLSTAPVREKLKFGVNTNIVLKSVSNLTRRTRDGLKSGRYCFMRFSEINPETKEVLAEYEFSHNKSTNSDWALKNTMHLFNQLTFISKAVAPKGKFAGIKTLISAAVNNSAYEKVMGKAVKGSELSETDLNELHDYCVGISTAFEEGVKPFVGVGGELLDLLVVTGKDIKYLELPREENNTITKAASSKTLELPSFYVKRFRGGASGNKVTGDAKPNSPLNLAAISGGADAMSGLEGI